MTITASVKIILVSISGAVGFYGAVVKEVIRIRPVAAVGRTRCHVIAAGRYQGLF
jgi:hypothetical protein